MKVLTFLTICGAILKFVASADFTTQELSGPWIISNRNKTISVHGSVPGEIYSSLWQAGKINDPTYRYNDQKYRWVSYENWTYTILMDVSKDILSKKVKYLEFEAIDAVSRVYLNGKLIGNTSSAFISYRFAIPGVRPQKNNLTVAFTSPVLYAKQRWEEYPYLVPPSCNPAPYQGECHYNFIRTVGSSFAWDWGPAFPSMGFWRPVRIVGFNSGRILGTKYSISENSDSSWSVSAGVNIESSSAQKLCISVKIAELNVSASQCWNFPGEKVTVVKTIKVADKIQKVKRWWPNGYGEQKLYKCDVQLSADGHAADNKSDNIGFRTIELIQTPVSDLLPGFTFYFVINHVKVFIKGSNWVPLDSFLPTLTSEKYQFVLKSAQAANMNMLRVFGGGLYEFDWLYEWADQYGILVWQDMMFAGAMYPTNKEFLSLVQTEIQQQIWRLQHHPSIALWSGSNENELAVGSGWYGAGSMNPLYVRNFRTLYVDVVKSTIYEVDPDRVFLLSSPTNGLKSEMDGGVSSNPGDTRYGDVHFYTYAGDLWNANTYPVTRFTSEFGFQSLPSLATWQTATNMTADLVPDGDLMKYREHHPSGLPQILAITLTYFKSPSPVNDTAMNYTRWAYLSQANQAMIYKTHVEMLRRHQCVLDSTGQGLTMGAMYWMINDIWQAPTWASIESTGRWKMLHYFARRFYSDVLVSPNIDGNTLTLHLGFTPKTPQERMWITGTVSTRCFDFKSLTPLGGFQMYLNELVSCPVTEVYEMDATAAATRCGCKDPSNCFAVFSFVDSHGTTLAENWKLFKAPKDIDFKALKKANLRISNARKIKGSFEFSLSIDRPDLFVWLDAANSSGWFSENGFAMYQKNKTVSFLPFHETNITPEDFVKQLSVSSLSDLYVN